MIWRYLTVFACLAMAGCSAVSSLEPVGDPAVAEDAKKIEGIWLTEDGDPLAVRHIKDNELRLGAVSWNEEELKFELEELALFVTTDDDRSYVNLKGFLQQEAKEFNYARLSSLEGETLVLFFPRTDAFTQAIENKTLSGTVKREENFTTVHLTATTAELNAFIDPEKASAQFDFDAPFTLRRVQRVEDEKKEE